MPCSIKRLSLAEVNRVASILRIAFDDRLPWLSGLHTLEEDREFLSSHVFINDEVWGAIDDEIFGFIAFREGWIDHLYVLPNRQRQGIGERLMDVAKSAWPELHLWTFQKNFAARAFYEKRGFTSIKETDGSQNEEREPDILYRWQQAA